MTYIFAILLLLLILDCKRPNADLFSPVRIYLGINFLALAVSFLKLLPAFTPFKLLTWFVLISSSAAFVLGYITYTCIRKIGYSTQKISSPFSINWQKYLIGVICLNFVFIVCYLINAKVSGGIPAFQSDPGLARIKFMTASYLPTMIILAYPTFFAVSYTAIRFSIGYKSLKFFAIFTTIATAILMILTVNRGSIVWIMIWVLLIEHYLHRNIRWRYLFVSLLLFLIFFAGMAKFREKDDSKIDLVKIGTNSIYAYFANNYWNLDYAFQYNVNKPPPDHTYGLESIAPLIEAVFLNKIRKAYNWESVFNENSVKVKGLNTVSYQYFIYKEFGWIGIVMFPFIISFVIAHVYYLAIKSKSIVYVHMYVLIFYAIFSSIFIPIWSMPFFWVSFSIPIFLHNYSRY